MEDAQKKYIICDCAPEKWGKTPTLKKLIDQLTHDSNYSFIEERGAHDTVKDKWFVFEHIHSKKQIIIQTEGDYDTSFNPTMEYLKEHQKDVSVVICASRGVNSNAYNEMQKMAIEYGMEIILFRNYHLKDTKGTSDLLYNLCAKQIKELLELIII